MSADFSQLGLAQPLLDTLGQLGITEQTDIQQQALPAVLAGKDVLGQGKTGSGKTLTFALGLLQQTRLTNFTVQHLVMCPTRELAEQVAGEIRKLGRALDNLKVLALCGGMPMGPQIASLKHGAHIIVGTPGRLFDHLLKKRLDLSALHCLVLDEADRMLEMGFADEVDAIVQASPGLRQTLLFSATYPAQIQQISHKIQRNPVQVKAVATHSENKIEQSFFEVEQAHKAQTCAALLSEYQPQSAMIFCNTKVACAGLAEQLESMGFAVAALHGDLEQKQRSQVLYKFANQSLTVLVATDVAARGLDVKGVDLVINYQLAFDAEVHIHRIGRTGRADATGQACSLCAPDEAGLANAIEDYQQQKLRWKGVQSLRFHKNRIQPAQYQTLCIDGGKKAKLRPGDILGALTQDAALPGEDIGKINITATHSYIAIKVRTVKPALRYLTEGKIKGRKYRARRI